MTATLRLATFNLESLDEQPDAPVPLARRIAVLRPQLERLRADVLCLQEVNGQHPPGGGPRQLIALDALLAGTPLADFHRAETSRVSGHDPKPGEARGADAVHNLVILSRYPFVEVREIRHELVAPPRYRPSTADPPAEAPARIEWNRPILYVAVTLPGGRALHLINLHLRAPLAAPVAGGKSDSATWASTAAWAEGFYLASMMRAGQALEARLTIDRVFDREPEALAAVVGDFNAEDRQAPLRTIRGDPADTGNPALAARALIPLESAVPATQRYSVVHGGHRQMLDHVLVSRALCARARSVEIDNEGLEDELGETGARSHHAPLVASFDLG